MSYIEFEDVKRLHQPYMDPIQRGPHWKPAHYNNAEGNMKRAFLATTKAALLWTPVVHYWSNMTLLSKFYEWPKGRAEYNIFLREVFRVPRFWKDLGNKLTFETLALGVDTGLKLAAWQYVYGGTWSPAEYADYNAFKNIFSALLATIPTCWTAVPLEMARRSYYADLTWPLEMRRGYKSPLNALMRIPFEEGPSYLFKGAFPIIARDFMFYSFFFATYSWIKNKLFFFWVYHDFSYEYMKFLMMAGAWTFACFVSYPCHFAREMVDLWPKERGGHCTWKNNYRVAITWIFENTDILFTNYFANYGTYMMKKGVPIFIAFWIADNLGMFTNVSESQLGLEQAFPLFLETA